MAATENSDREGTPSTTTAVVSKADVEHAAPKQLVSLWSYLVTDVDPAQANVPLAAYCFMTGYMWVAHIFLRYGPCSHSYCTAMLFLSRRSSFGAVFKPVILRRWVKLKYLILSWVTNLFRIVGYSTRPSFWRRPRSYIPQGWSASIVLLDQFQSWYICHWTNRRSGGGTKTDMAHRWYIHPDSPNYGCCYCILESWTTQYIQLARWPRLDKCINFCWLGLHECKPRRARCTRQTSEHAIRSYRCVLFYIFILLYHIHASCSCIDDRLDWTHVESSSLQVPKGFISRP